MRGYGDISPATPEGRLAAVALTILGITLWAAITGTITRSLVIGEERSEGSGVPDQPHTYSDLMCDGLLTQRSSRPRTPSYRHGTD